MAFLTKNTLDRNGGRPLLREWRHVPRATQNTHNVGVASSTYGIYTVTGGYCLVWGMFATVTTLIQTQTCNLSVNINPTTGVDYVIASTLDITARNVGVTLNVEGDGTAVVASGTTTIGGYVAGYGFSPWVVAPGGIEQILSADNTGSFKWDLWYEPMETGARIEATALNTTLGA